jgi:hypothetical protein
MIRKWASASSSAGRSRARVREAVKGEEVLRTGGVERGKTVTLIASCVTTGSPRRVGRRAKEVISV